MVTWIKPLNPVLAEERSVLELILIPYFAWVALKLACNTVNADKNIMWFRYHGCSYWIKTKSPSQRQLLEGNLSSTDLHRREGTSTPVEKYWRKCKSLLTFFFFFSCFHEIRSNLIGGFGIRCWACCPVPFSFFFLAVAWPLDTHVFHYGEPVPMQEAHSNLTCDWMRISVI